HEYVAQRSQQCNGKRQGPQQGEACRCRGGDPAQPYSICADRGRSWLRRWIAPASPLVTALATSDAAAASDQEANAILIGVPDGSTVRSWAAVSLVRRSCATRSSLAERNASGSRASIV